jgi:hypothetical protein
MLYLILSFTLDPLNSHRMLCTSYCVTTPIKLVGLINVILWGFDMVLAGA